MRTIFGGLLLAFTVGAYADGVPLFTTGPALSASDVARVSAARPTKNVASAIVNRHAIDSNVITATLGGKTYRFVGTQRKLEDSIVLGPAPAASGSAGFVTMKQDGGVRWEGTSAEGGRAVMSRSEAGVFGEFFVDGKRYWLVRDGPAAFVVVELAPPSAGTVNYDEVTPELLERIRKRYEESRKGVKP